MTDWPEQRLMPPDPDSYTDLQRQAHDAFANSPRSGVRGWLTMGIYQPLFLLAFLLYGPVLLWRLWFAKGGQRTSMRERMGFVPTHDGERPLVWIHGVSVGEVKAASNFVAELRRFAAKLAA